MSELLTIKEIAALMGVTTKTVRRWEEEGKIKAIRTIGGHRRFNKYEVLKMMETQRLTVAYLRVGSNRQQELLREQLAIVEAYRDRSDESWEIIQDVGSGANYGNHGLLRLLDLLCDQRVQRLVLLHKSSLPRLGSDLIFRLCEIFKVEIVILNSYEITDSEVEWQQDAEEIFEQLTQQLNAIHQHHDQELKQQLQAVISQLINKISNK